ncbi:hypothetical protein [Methylobacterium haplocladii]|uniref:SCP domain-containing protein n=1 Tax=Methylobacterium haplocladii TaxID=1176176 RepID=A0A512IN23_9HYPH|nr:hypothetical protein [Methylobacterium haplocladii]GEO99085.1 hypothetical protein MHA02_14730 [Methylobacterium haplocladii]GJD84069.1 hypothetical protein HPGCJGGD_1944 [Methylobacterium haplocladii]GLS60060.1 hypothetical protein GCM10007887_27370 [Methylobacterium haplocladii]
MIRTALACLLLLSTAARADECDTLVGQIAQATGAKKVGKRVGPSVDVKAASGLKIDVTCRAEPIVQVASSEPSPSAAYYRDLSIAGGLAIGVPPATVEAALVRAYETALRERRKSFIQQSGWSASCYADPGSSSLRTLCSVGRIPPG